MADLSGQIGNYFKKRTAYVPNRFDVSIGGTNIDPMYIKSIDYGSMSAEIANDVYADANSIHRLPYIKRASDSLEVSIVIQESGAIDKRGALYGELRNDFLTGTYENRGTFKGVDVIIREIDASARPLTTIIPNCIFNNISSIKMDAFSKTFLEYTVTLTCTEPMNIYYNTPTGGPNILSSHSIQESLSVEDDERVPFVEYDNMSDLMNYLENISIK